MNDTVKKITGVGVLTALVVLLQIFSNYVQFGPISISLALIPIAVGAILYGPWAGLFLGAAAGAIILTAPSTAAFYTFARESSHPVLMILAIILLCLLKTGLAGLAAGFIFKVFKNNHDKIGAIIASISVPLINTGLFILVSMWLFVDLFGSIGYLITMVISINFLIEFVVNAALSPVVYYIVKVVEKRQQTKNYEEE